MRKALIPLLMALLAGCGTFVQVRHPWVVSRVGAPDLPGLGNLYVVLDRYEAKAPSGFAGALLSRALGPGDDSAVNRSLAPVEEAGILRAVSAVFSGPWTGLAGWSVGNSSTTRFLEEIRPSMVLELRPGLLEGRQDREEVAVTDSSGRETGKRTVFRLFARFAVSYQLKEWPSGRVVARGGFSREASAESPQQAGLASWLAAQASIREDWVAEMYRELAPFPVERTRRLRTSKKADPGDAEWNSGVACEKAGDWAGARTHYASAMAGIPKKSDRQELQSYINQLALVASLPPPAAARPLPALWAEPVAVLPFGNESNNVSAPEELRKTVANRLAMMGYRLVPLENTDAGLRARGVTIGEHLRSLKPAEIPAAAGANRLIGGTVEVFSVVNIGVYYKREVRIRLWMLDANGVPVWESVGDGFREMASDRPGETFLAGLFGGMGEKMSGTYLKEEGNSAVLGALGALPARGVR